MYARSTRKYANPRELSHELSHKIGEPDGASDRGDFVDVGSERQSTDGSVTMAVKSALKAAIDADQYELAATLLETLRGGGSRRGTRDRSPRR